jgi:hypothetical protein
MGGGSGIEERFEISKWETSVEEDEAKKFCRDENKFLLCFFF